MTRQPLGLCTVKKAINMLLAILLCLLPVVTGEEPPMASFRPFCPSNQRWYHCGPPCGDRRCPRSLDRFDSSKRDCNSRHCAHPGCYCQDNYVRNDNGDCIQERDCPPQCQDNEQLDKCGNDCELQCPSSLIEAGRQPSCYRQKCGRPACVCKPGYYRSPRGVCAKLEDCPNICGPNEFYNPCGNACEDTCSQFNSGQRKVCPAICMKDGACQCKSGFYRNTWGQCVPSSMCLQCNGRHEVASKCASPPQCQPHCANSRWNFDHKHCQKSDVCRPGCVCGMGYVRDSQNNCIPREFCDRFPPPRGK